MTREERIEIAKKCNDSAVIPKVANAGQVIEGERPYQIMHNGIKTYTDSHYGAFNVEIIKYLKGIHEPQEEKVFYEVLKVIPKGATMIELGSFWAYYSMWFNSQIPDAKNYMVEPMSEILQLGVQNFELNNLKGDFNQACVGQTSQKDVSFKHWDDEIHTINQICIDDFMKEKNIQYLDILHSDIQGAEYDMLQGAKQSFADNKIGFVFISTHSEKVHFKCLDFIKKNNFTIISEHTLAESYSTDGLIAAAHVSKKFPKVKISGRFTLQGVKIRLKNLIK